MEVGKLLATRVLSKLGFQVDSIPEAAERTADLRVTDDESQYLIEVKEKEEGDTQAENRRAILARGDLYEQSDLLAHDNRISGVLADARKQLDATQKAPATFQLIWFHATGVDADLKYRQAFSTFYGIVHLFALNPRQQDTVDCFYFDYSASYNMPTVEALILSDNEQLQFCLNEFSERASEFRKTRLCGTFKDLDGVIDPAAMESKGQIISCRAKLTRKNDAEIVKALREQTGIEYSPIRLTRHACSAAVNLRVT